MTKRQLKPYVGILLILIYAIDIFVFSSILGRKFGMWGTFLHELILLAMAVGTILLFKADVRAVFPLHKPRASKVFGTLVFWMGSFWGAMLLTMMAAYFFPNQVMGISQGLGNSIDSISFWASILIVSVTPAICEEAAFRGALYSSFKGIKGKWPAIILVAVIFGAFHGSIWRFIPTAILGLAMGYLLAETGNMFYNMLFHFVNNAVPIILLFLMNKILSSPVMGDEMSQAADAYQITRLPLASVAIYFFYGGAAPFLVYIGNYLIHKGEPGYDRGIFPREKRNILIGLIVTSFLFMAVGVFLIIASVYFDRDLYYDMNYPM